MATEWASLGSFLFRAPGGEHPDARGQGRGYVEDLFASSDELLGQQVAQPTGRLDGPGALLERFGTTDQLFHLAPGGPHPDARELVFCLVDGHRCVRCLVRIDADHHMHDYLLRRDGTTEGTPACRLFVLDPLLSHSMAKPWREALRTKATQQIAGGRHYTSDPTRTSKRYGSGAVSAPSLKQALLGQVSLRRPIPYPGSSGWAEASGRPAAGSVSPMAHRHRCSR